VRGIGTRDKVDAEAGMLNKVTRVDQPLTTAERSKLAELEGVIGQGEQWFMRVGVSLKVIRDEKLYRDEFPTFEAYCQQRWKFTRARASQLIGAADVVEDLSTSGLQTQPILPQTERVTRPLKALPKEERRPAWDAAVLKSANGHPTEKDVAAVIKERKPAPPEDEPEGNPWDAHNEGIREIVSDLKQTAVTMRRIFDAEGTELKSKWCKRMSWSATLGQLNALVRYLETDGRIAGTDSRGIITVADQKTREAGKR
jgi:hypothetical protein